MLHIANDSSEFSTLTERCLYCRGFVESKTFFGVFFLVGGLTRAPPLTSVTIYYM